jgi:hypothetical protein
MLSFTEWQEALGEVEEELDYLEDLIAYRKIEIKCAETPDLRRRLTEAQQEILDADPVLRDLNYKREHYLKKKFFIQQHGELPPEVEA